MENKKIILIGGSPTVGKTTLAKQLSKKLEIPWISTDSIREMMKDIVKEENYPHLFGVEKYNAEDFLSKFSIKEIVEFQNKESEDVWKGVKSFIENDYIWHSFIVEGVAILPHLVSRNFKNKNIKTIFLVDEDADSIKEVVFKRGLWDEANKYSDILKEKEIEWVKEFSSWLKKECRKYNFSFLEIDKNKDNLKEVIKILGL